jgi:hypothetical protein
MESPVQEQHKNAGKVNPGRRGRQVIADQAAEVSAAPRCVMLTDSFCQALKAASNCDLREPITSLAMAM